MLGSVGRNEARSSAHIEDDAEETWTHSVGQPSDKQRHDETVIASTLEGQGIGKTQATRWQKVD